MVSFEDCIHFIDPVERNQKVKAILTKYNFNQINLSTSDGINTFIGNLKDFEKELIRDGVEIDEIDVIIQILKGNHPLSGQPKPASGDYAKFGGAGWKIHLTVKPKNHKFVYYWLLQNLKFGWKYLQGGEDGKTFTIYVGSWDSTEEFAILLNSNLNDKIENPVGEVLKDDIEVKGKVWARFDTPRYSEFHQYGGWGLPFLKEDMRFITLNRDEYMKNKKKIQGDFLKKSYAKLNEIYGVYFRGSRDQVTKRVVWVLNNLAGHASLPDF